MIKFITNNPNYRPLRATVLGCGGTGKSHIINTLVLLVRRLINYEDSIKVAAHSGGAAYNVQGCTLHRLLSLSVNTKTLCKILSDDRQAKLATKLKNLLILMIDERSMLNSNLVGAAERNLRHCVFGQQNDGVVFQ